MIRTVMMAMVVLGFCAMTWADDTVGASSDESAVRQVFQDLDAAWGKHDAKAVAALYSQKADIITEKGDELDGRDAIEQALGNGFAGNLQDTTLTETIDRIRMIKPDVALVDCEATITHAGADTPHKVHLVSIVSKVDGKWLLETSRAIVYGQ